MEWVTGLACLAFLVLPAAIGLGAWMGLKQRKKAETDRDALAERIALGGFTPTTPDPWLAGEAQGRPVRVKVTITAAYRASSSDAPASMRLGQKLVAVLPLSIPRLEGSFRRTGTAPEGRDFGAIWEALPTGHRPPPALETLLMEIAHATPERRFSLGDADDRWMYADGLFLDATCVLRAESPPIDHLPTLHQWLADLDALATRLEETVS